MSDTASSLKVAASTLSKWISSAEENQGNVTLRGSGNYSFDSIIKYKLKRKFSVSGVLEYLGVSKSGYYS